MRQALMTGFIVLFLTSAAFCGGKFLEGHPRPINATVDNTELIAHAGLGILSPSDVTAATGRAYFRNFPDFMADVLISFSFPDPAASEDAWQSFRALTQRPSDSAIGRLDTWHTERLAKLLGSAESDNLEAIELVTESGANLFVFRRKIAPPTQNRRLIVIIRTWSLPEAEQLLGLPAATLQPAADRRATVLDF
jgi:hypothetical protein